MREIIRQIVRRDCHVSESDRKVIRHVISRLSKGYETFQSLDKAERKALMRECLNQHKLSRDLYSEVMK